MTGTHGSPSSAGPLRALGAKPARLDLLDARAVRNAVLQAEPEAIVHEAIALANVTFARDMDKVTARTSEPRTTGTDALLAAAGETGMRRFVAAQSVAPSPGTPTRVGPSRPRTIRSTRRRRRTSVRAPLS